MTATIVQPLTLTPHQADAAARVLDLIRSGREETTMGGLGGSGKSSVARHLLDRLPGWRAASFTGKACDVLRRKGVHAETLHSLMYKPVVEKIIDPRTGKVVKEIVKGWTLKTKLRGIDGEDILGLLVDEASMISQVLHRDVTSFGVPVLWVGDHGQLPPVGGDPNLMADPDVVLEEILRQEEGSGIIDFAHALRMGFVPGPSYRYAQDYLRQKDGWKNPDIFPDVEVIRSDDLTTEVLASADRVIVGWNKTRCALNRVIREARGFRGPLDAGEELICLKNNRERGLFNGMILTVENVNQLGDAFFVDCVSEAGARHDGLEMEPARFGELDKDEQDDFDYAYAVTAHKAQGAQWDHVIVIEETAGSWDMRRWRYTAATRAVKRLTWVVR